MQTIFYLFWLCIAIRNSITLLRALKVWGYGKYLTYKHGVAKEKIQECQLPRLKADQSEFDEHIQDSHNFYAHGSVSPNLINNAYRFLSEPEFYLTMVEFVFLFIGLFTENAIYFYLYTASFIVNVIVRIKVRNVFAAFNHSIFFFFLQTLILSVMLFNYFFHKL